MLFGGIPSGGDWYLGDPFSGNQRGLTLLTLDTKILKTRDGRAGGDALGRGPQDARCLDLKKSAEERTVSGSMGMMCTPPSDSTRKAKLCGPSKFGQGKVQLDGLRSMSSSATGGPTGASSGRIWIVSPDKKRCQTCGSMALPWT